ncbi:MAG TPA: alpha/beta hydrolase [Vitreimonas sp.]|jgi:acetyl esterase/lipase|nr:alpha/beta hydrolase [Vitreimonas sp.]
MRRRNFWTVGAAALAAACTPTLAQFNAFTPKDTGGRRVRRDLAYGENPRQKLDLYAPQNLPIGVPVVVFIYGGSWNSGAKADYEFVGDAVASRGFLTAIPDYRLVPDVRFPTFVEDCAAAVRTVIDHAADLGADPSKVVLMGHSAGAYNAIMLGLNSHYLRTAGVNPGLVRGVVGLAGPYDFLPLDVPSTQDAFGQTSDLQRTQPTQFARRDGPPLLLLWGEKDSTVHRRSIDAMQHAAQTVGESVEAKIYPGVDHVGIMLALSRLFRGNAPVLDDSAAFIRRVTT